MKNATAPAEALSKKETKQMKLIAIYDNGGVTADRYTVIIDATYKEGHRTYNECLSLSSDPGDPRGVSQWGGCVIGEHLGSIIKFENMPAELQAHIARRLFCEGQYVSIAVSH